MNSIVEEFLMEDFLKIVVFIITYNDCSNINLLLQQKVGDMFTYPRGYPNLADISHSRNVYLSINCGQANSSSVFLF